MSIIDTLITDRTQADVTKLKSLLSKPKAMWTQDEWSEFILARDKGAYNATDLNRVQEAMEYLAERFRGYGYNVPEIKRPSITASAPGASRLPSNFTQLEYIQSSGMQYVDTGFKLNQDTRVVIDACITEYVGSYLYGAQVSSGSNFYASGYTGETKLEGWFSTIGTVSVDTALKRRVIDHNRNILTTDDGYSLTFSAATFQSSNTMFLFGINNGSLLAPTKAKVFSCQLYDNGTLVRNYIPCKNDAGEVGLWDDVNSEFYGNAGTGTFATGPVVPQEMAESDIVELEYIESTGTQYVDTGFVPNQDTRVVCDCEYVATSSASWLFGVRVASGRAAFAFLAYEGKFRTDYNNSYSLYFDAGTTKATHVDKAKNVTVVNGSETINDTYAAFNSQYSLFLLAVNTAGTTNGYSTAKIKACQIYDNGTLVRDFIPAKTVAGEIGLYDKVFKKFYRNAGTGTFTAGPEIGSVGVTERDYWEIGDIPRQEQMDQYLTNLGYVKNVLGLLKSTPESPATMNYLTYTEANAIEQILVDIEFVITHTVQSMSRLNAFMFVSGYRPFPS